MLVLLAVLAGYPAVHRVSASSGWSLRVLIWFGASIAVGLCLFALYALWLAARMITRRRREGRDSSVE